jgi:RHS repeat-associated protein
VVDSSGQAIIAGYTTSNTGFPLQGALYASYRGSTDAFVSKFNAAGSALVFSTYLGGSNEDKANAITLDPSGNIVIAGETESGGAGATVFPTQGAMDGTFASGGACTGGHCKDVFISKLNAAGSSLLYSTFFGGTGVEEANGVAADSGAIYATGIVTATGMSTKNYYDNIFNGPTDAFLIKVNPATSGSNGLLYSTYLGGSSDDQGHALALGSSGKVYLTGDTKSSNYPTKTAYQGSNAGGQDAFVTAIDTTQSGTNSLLYSTYLGGSATDEGDGIVLDASSNAYITGSTTSSAWPTKTPWQAARAGDHDAILTEINPAAATGAASLLYSSYIGSIADDRGQAIARDSSGVLYLTGYTNSITYPVTLAVQPTFGGGTCGTISCTDVFVTAFNITANAPVYSTFLGNNNNDQGLAIVADSSGAAYVAGYTDGTFPTSVSPRQAASGGQRDAFVAKLTQPTLALGASTATVAESTSAINLTVTLSAVSPVTITVDYTTANGTATAGSDYTAQSGTLTFAPGVTTQPISVPIANDLSDEPNETFTVTLSGPYGARLGAIPSTTVTITDDDAPPLVSWQGANTNVGEAAGSALVPVILNAPSAFTVTVAYATSNGTATAGSDYTTSSGTLTFAPSQTALNVSIPILNDATAEPNETVTLTLSSPTNATLGSPNPATLTIVDNDGGASGGDEYYQYDALGDLLQKGATAYTYGANGNGTGAGPHQARSVGGQPYSYDADGNLTSGGTRTSLIWDTENRLTSVTNAGVTETYGYDADGERITRTTAGVTTVYLGGLWEETSAGAVKQYYSFNGTVVAVRDSSLGVSYIHGDHLGSVSATTGVQAGGQTFGPWGNLTSGGSSATSRNYTGQYLDSTTGLLYYHARYYDATLARFISADSVVPGQTATSGAPNPQQLNRYNYVANNPLTSNDPSGHTASDGKDGPVGPVEGAGGGSGPDVPLPDYPVRQVQGEAELRGMTVESNGSVHPTGQNAQMGPEAGEAGQAGPSVESVAAPQNTCVSCGTQKPDLARGSGQLRIDPEDGASVYCATCLKAGATEAKPGTYWIKSYDSYAAKALEKGVGTPEYTPQYGGNGHFSTFNSEPSVESGSATWEDLNQFVRTDKTNYNLK